MGFLTVRTKAISTYAIELVKYGCKEQEGSFEDDVIFLLDGVGGFQFAPIIIRKSLRSMNSDIGTIVFRWQFGLPGEIWTDLMWHRRNRHMAIKLARKILAFHRRHPSTRIHVIAYSGGAGIAVFALEALKSRPIIETLVLPCPAISPDYNLAPALRMVKHAFVLTSIRDRIVLGLGTRVFGTTDRQFVRAGGNVGFHIPRSASEEDIQAYDRLREIAWTSAMGKEGHYGGHTGWANVHLLCKHLLPILRGEPLLPTQPVREGD